MAPTLQGRPIKTRLTSGLGRPREQGAADNTHPGPVSTPKPGLCTRLCIHTQAWRLHTGLASTRRPSIWPTEALGTAPGGYSWAPTAEVLIVAQAVSIPGHLP